MKSHSGKDCGGQHISLARNEAETDFRIYGNISGSEAKNNIPGLTSAVRLDMLKEVLAQNILTLRSGLLQTPRSHFVHLPGHSNPL